MVHINMGMDDPYASYIGGTMSYIVGKVYRVDTLVVCRKSGKRKMKKRKRFDLLSEDGRTVESGIPKKERKFYKQFIALANKEGAIL
jgi:hypothetical protein